MTPLPCLRHLAVLSLCTVTSLGAGEPADRVALVSALTGEATIATPPEMEARPLRLFSWLPTGARVEVSKGSSVTLVFADGRRFEIAGEARAVVTSEAAEALLGAVRALEALPPMPSIAAISRAAAAGAEPGAVRLLRGDRQIQDLYPRDGATSIANDTTLRFAPIEGAAYRVEVQDLMGTTVFEALTHASEIRLAPGVLKDGAAYYWTVRTVETAGPSVRGMAEFTTLPTEAVEKRAALRRSVGTDRAESLALLAAIDQRLGLLIEAREGFRLALEQSPRIERYREALGTIEHLLWPGDDAHP